MQIEYFYMHTIMFLPFFQKYKYKLFTLLITVYSRNIPDYKQPFPPPFSNCIKKVIEILETKNTGTITLFFPVYFKWPQRFMLWYIDWASNPGLRTTGTCFTFDVSVGGHAVAEQLHVFLNGLHPASQRLQVFIRTSCYTLNSNTYHRPQEKETVSIYHVIKWCRF